MWKKGTFTEECNGNLNNYHSNYYVITGGPGVGKSTLLDDLEQSGFICVPEVAREIIKEQLKINGEAMPWKDIYLTDSERKQTWEEAVLTYEVMVDTYRQYGYELIEVPRVEVDKRAKFVTSHIELP